MRRYLYLWGVFFILAIPALACGSSAARITPTPTKTPRLIRTVESISATASPTEVVLPTNTFTPEVPPTDTPLPQPVATDTPTPEPVPPTDTPTPEPPPPTNTPVPPPPTDTPVPPPTDTPAPPTATSPPANQGPTVTIDLPDGDKYDQGDEVEVNITVRDSDGVDSFEWGVFTQNNVAIEGGDKDCGGSECSISEEFDASLPGIFQIGVEAVDSQGNNTIEVKQIYVG